MKQFFLLSALAIGMLSCAAQDKAPASPRETVSSENISVSYGRPSKKGREIYGGLVKYGEVWRTGANEATEITFKKDAVFAGKAVKAGTYTLFTIPGKTEWVVLLNSELKQWGAYNYDKIKGKNVLEAKAASSASGSVTEQFTITVSDNAVVLLWDQTQVTIPVSW